MLPQKIRGKTMEQYMGETHLWVSNKQTNKTHQNKLGSAACCPPARLLVALTSPLRWQLFIMLTTSRNKYHQAASKYVYDKDYRQINVTEDHVQDTGEEPDDEITNDP